MFPRATVAPNVHDRSAFASQRKLTGHQPPRDSQTRVRFFDSTEGPRYCLPINADHQPVVAVDDPCDCGRPQLGCMVWLIGLIDVAVSGNVEQSVSVQSGFPIGSPGCDCFDCLEAPAI
jgi:hypothetical protein